MALCLMALTQPARGQLISPGKLSRVHADLSGMTRCTQCHNLGERGVAPDKCLDCHTPLKRRMAREAGFHASLDTRDCGQCHKEHFGLDFRTVRFDTTAFDHGATGFALRGGHADVACRDCHTPPRITAPDVLAFKGRHDALTRTFLGLATACAACHQDDDPHRGQFADRTCDTCHDETTWKQVPAFSHDQTRFPLTGRHRDVDCAGCHPTGETPPVVQYRGLAFDGCASCHADPHDGRMGGTCATCHRTDGWHRLERAALERRFDHDGTGFSLRGAHAILSCDACHASPARRTETLAITFKPATRNATYPAPEADQCTSCHRDAHHGDFRDAPGGPTCDNCHTEVHWLPSRYSFERHNRETDFALTGAHLSTPCTACHTATDANPHPFRFTSEAMQCRSCHAPDNPHGDQFAGTTGETVCSDCHTTDAWDLNAGFDHDRTRFPLEGAHRNAACADCHAAPAGGPRRYRGLDLACAACHGTDDPHEGQFAGRACDTCHDVRSFRLSAFDHAGTRFPLEGAHADLACRQCHPTEQTPAGVSFVRFAPLGTACIDCHPSTP